MEIDLRSDTVTKPSSEMLNAMMNAKVGDDVYAEDPTVNLLQKKAAELFGKENALFCASGTMTNQIAIKAHTQPGDEVILDQYSHVYLYEGGGMMQNSQVSVALLKGNLGRINASQIKSAINNKNDIHRPLSSLVVLENTMNRGGGSYYDPASIKEIRELCINEKLSLHLDGARLFNALVEQNVTTQTIGSYFDSISLCLSKGLGCPIGSLLIGSNELISKAKRIRKWMGGAWRQAGHLAAAGIYALDNNILRLKLDNQNAHIIGEELKNFSWITQVNEVFTNIVLFEVDESIGTSHFIEVLKKQGILVSPFGINQIRLVTHLDITEEKIQSLINQLKKIEF